MRTPREFLAELVQTLSKDFLSRVPVSAPSIFLIGAQSARANSLRARLRRELTSRPHVRRLSELSVVYPEEIFEELLGGTRTGSYDLLGLEEMLAVAADLIVILLEGSGAIAELGAFAGHASLGSKLLVVVDESHKKDRSFIMLGPIRYLATRNKRSVLYVDFQAPDLDKLGAAIRSAVGPRRWVERNALAADNPFGARLYLLAALYVCNELDDETLQDLVRSASGLDQRDSAAVAGAALGMLERFGLVGRKGNSFVIARRGQSDLRSHVNASWERGAIWTQLDNLRLAYLNIILRDQRFLNDWGEVIPRALR